MYRLYLKPAYRFVALFLLVLLLLSGCASRAVPIVEEVMVEREVASAPSAKAIAPYEGGEFASGGTVTDVTQQSTERIVIKNASLSLVVDDPSKSMSTISSLADELGGFVVNANLYHQELDSGAKVPRAHITIRIPAEKLNDVLARIKSESSQDPLSEDINSQDVTSEYTDLQSRLRNLENAESKLTEIMASATKTEDVLAVYNQLVQVQEQIEVIKGQIKYFNEAAALSAVSVELLANEAVQPLTIGGWQPAGVAKDAIQTLINALKGIANVAIWIILFLLPVLVVAYVIFFLPFSLLWKAWRRRRVQKKKPEPLAPPQEK